MLKMDAPLLLVQLKGGEGRRLVLTRGALEWTCDVVNPTIDSSALSNITQWTTRPLCVNVSSVHIK